MITNSKAASLGPCGHQRKLSTHAMNAMRHLDSAMGQTARLIAALQQLRNHLESKATRCTLDQRALMLLCAGCCC